MNVKYARRMAEAKPSFIRECLKLSADPSIISFAGGNPDADSFPVEKVKDGCMRVLEQAGREALQYAVTEGYVELRKLLLERMKALGLNGDLENLVITSGSQQGLDILGKLFLNEGDQVIIESPSYMGAINAFKYYQPEFVEVEMDENGMDMDSLENQLKKCRRVKFIYTIPDFQNPTGRTMCIERRKRIVRLAEKYEIFIIEDSPYYDLRFSGNSLPPIKFFDKADWVIYLGSMSKILCPALRVGWVFGDREIVNQYTMLKQAADLHSNELGQRVVADYLKNQDIGLHISEINDVYRKKRDIMLENIRRSFPKTVRYTCPEGGLFIWLMLPEDCDAQVFFEKALREEKVCFVPGDTFYPYGGHKNTIRLSYATMSNEQIHIGMERLAKIFKELNE